MKPLFYNYHDSIIDKLKITSATIALYLDLYPIYYPSEPKIKLSFALTDDLDIFREWTKRLVKQRHKEANYLGFRIDNIEIKKDEINSQNLLCKIGCDHMDPLNFRCKSFKETEIKIEIQIDKELLNICNNIVKENLTLQEWTEIESDDIFQTEKYEGGFDGTEQEFVFSFYLDTEYWFQLSLRQVNEISEGKLKSVSAIQADYYAV